MEAVTVAPHTKAPEAGAQFVWSHFIMAPEIFEQNEIVQLYIIDNIILSLCDWNVTE